MEHGHTRAEIRLRLNEGNKTNYLADFIYGGIDGTVTTFALVAGVQGAGFSHNIVLALGFANILADGFSMAASNYLGTKAEHDDVARVLAIENRHIDEFPEGERTEVREILALKGIPNSKLEMAVDAITCNRETWLNYMLAEEYGMSKSNKRPVKAGGFTFLSFLVCGAIPLIPFVAGMPDPFFYASVATAFSFFFIGAMKSRWSLTTWWWSGCETLAIGAIAAAIAYFVGFLVAQS